MSRQGGPWAMAIKVIKAVERLPRVLRAAAVLVAVSAFLGLTLAVLGLDEATHHGREGEPRA